MNLDLKMPAIWRLVFLIGATLVIVKGVMQLWPENDQEDQRKVAVTDRKSRKRLPRVNRANAPSLAHRKMEQARSSISNRMSVEKRRVKFALFDNNEEDDWTDEDGNPWPEDQKQLMREISLASRDDDFNALSGLSELVLNNDNAEIRERYVAELGWFGEEAVPELLAFMSDKNEEVANAARDQWLDGVQSMENDAEKAVLLTAVSQAMTDTDALEMFADELIGMDDLLAMQTIVDVIDTGTPQASEAVKGVYEIMTGKKWSDVDAAESWLQENYDEELLEESEEESEKDRDDREDTRE